MSKILATVKNLLIRSHFHYFRMSMLHPPYWLSVNGRSTKIFADNNSGSATCYREIIVDDCYDLINYSKHFQPKVIVDIGANIGVFSKFCSLLFPESTIFAYEPNPSALKWLEQNAQNTNIQIYPFAVAKDKNISNLKIDCDSTIGSLSSSGTLPVQCIPSTEVAGNLLINFLKIDCEGSEWLILQNPSLLERTQNLCLEYHLYENHTVQELIDLVQAANHKIIRIQPNQEYDGKFGLLWSSHNSLTQGS